MTRQNKKILLNINKRTLLYYLWRTLYLIFNMTLIQKRRVELSMVLITLHSYQGARLSLVIMQEGNGNPRVDGDLVLGSHDNITRCYIQCSKFNTRLLLISNIQYLIPPSLTLCKLLRPFPNLAKSSFLRYLPPGCDMALQSLQTVESCCSGAVALRQTGAWPWLLATLSLRCNRLTLQSFINSEASNIFIRHRIHAGQTLKLHTSYIRWLNFNDKY